ncbi:hypothetical protein C8Q80DRAFT_1275293 [Daedaleopsis nitida]|nr:hypothetical protein C8Q80DRAFT_1275293 [Daedaleopsis nitida]
MNGVPSAAQPPQPQPQGVPPPVPPHPTDHASPVPLLQTSHALFRGAQSLMALIEIRTAAVQAEYEERIRVLLQERDALSAQARDQPVGAASNAELIALRREREVWQQQRIMWEDERKKWIEERAAIVCQRDEDAKRRHEAEEQAGRLRAELLRLHADNERLTALASGSRMQTPQARLPDGVDPSDGVGITANSDLEENFDLTPFIRSPTSSTTVTLPSLSSSASSTMSSISSPPHDSSPPRDSLAMEVRSPPLLPFPFDSVRVSSVFPHSSFRTWSDEQLGPHSPTPTARSSEATLSTQSPTPVPSSGSATRSTPLSDAAGISNSRGSSAQAPIASRTLKIRIPTSEEPVRIPIKPRPSVLLGEKMEVVTIPRLGIPDEEEDELMLDF